MPAKKSVLRIIPFFLGVFAFSFAHANAQVSVSCSLPANGEMNVAYSGSCTASGGTAPYTFAVSGQPAGLNPSTTSPSVTISGTPTASGASTVTVTATDSTGVMGSATPAPTINVYPALTLSCPALATATVGVAVTGACSASGGAGTGTYRYSIVGANPPSWLAIDPGAGTLSGQPAAIGTYSFSFNATDGLGTATQAVSLTVYQPLAISTTAVPVAIVGQPYTTPLAATGGSGNYTWSLASGSTLPMPLMLNPAGVISGTPNAAVTNAQFTVIVTDTTTTLTQSAALTISITAGLSITTNSVPNGYTGQPYSTMLTASGGSGNYTWGLASGSSLPLPLQLSLGGVISGTPSTVVTNAQFTVVVTDTTTSQTLSKPLTITITSGVSITTTSIPNGYTGQPYSTTLAATGGSGNYSWSLASGSTLPLPLQLSPAGVISGTPSAAVTNAQFTVVVTDTTTSETVQGNLAISVVAGLTITSSASLPGGFTGQSYSTTLAAANGQTPYSWSWSGTTPPGLNINSATGVISGKPTNSGNYSFQVAVADSTSPTKQSSSQNVSLSIGQGVSITTTSIPNGYTGQPYLATLAATGGSGNYSWSLASGSTLPSPLQLSPAGVISGTPGSTATNASFTVVVTDTTTLQAVQGNLSISIGAGLTITSGAALPGGFTGQPYSTALTATNGLTPYSWSWSGNTPPGLNINSGSGVINGTPTSAGNYSFIVSVSDNTSPTKQSTSLSVSLSISQGLTITTTSVPAGYTGQPYSTALSASNGSGSYSWAVTGGSLPLGLSLSLSGTIGGTPTTAGNYSFTVTVTDTSSPAQTQTKTFSNVSISQGLTITSKNAPNGSVGLAYSYSLTAANGSGSYSWSVTSGSLPANVRLTGNVLNGTPNTTGSYTFTVTVTDTSSPVQTKSQQFTVVISAGLTITTAPVLPSSFVNNAGYSVTLAAQNGLPPFSWSYTGNVPPGLNLSTAGVISGKPTTAGTFTFTATVMDSTTPTAQSNSETMTITIAPLLTFGSSTFASGSTNLKYSSSCSASGGTPPYSYSISGNPPAGLAFSSPCTISGVPISSGTSSFSITVKDTSGQSVTQQFSITIGQGLTINPPFTLPTGTQSSPYAATQLAASNGQAPYTWSWGGNTPSGLNLSSSGVISGTPTTPGTFSFTVKVTDSGSPQQSSAQTFSLTVNPYVAPAAPTFTFTGVPSSPQTPGVGLSGVGVSASPTSSGAWPIKITLGFTPNATGVSNGYIDPALQFVDSSGNKLGTTYSVTLPANTGALSLPQIDPGTVEGEISLTLSVTGQAGATSTFSVPASVPIITPGSVQVTNLTSSGFEVELVGNSSPRELQSATFTFSAASGATINGNTAFTVDVSSLMSGWYTGTSSQQYGSEFSLTVPFTFSGSSSAIGSVSVTLTNSVGTSTAVSGTI